jgi:hypothetical protein
MIESDALTIRAFPATNGPQAGGDGIMHDPIILGRPTIFLDFCIVA